MSVFDRHCFFCPFIFSKIGINAENVSIPLCLVPLYLCIIVRINKLKNMKKSFLIPLMLLATLMLTAACSEKDPTPDEQEQITPEENDGEEGNEGNNEEGGNVEEGNGISLLQGAESVNVRFERQ